MWHLSLESDREAGGWINASLEYSHFVKGTSHKNIVLKGFSWKYLPCVSLKGLGGPGRAEQTYCPEQKDPLLSHLSVDHNVMRVGPKEEPCCTQEG